MWLRRLLVALYGLEERSAHTPEEVDWTTLPERCVLQIHWRRSRDFRRRLHGAGFGVVVLARHPLDVLLSILQFASHEPETARWLDGLGGDEQSIIGAEPISTSFQLYAASARARALLNLSSEWWDHALFTTRYEDLVASPAAELARLTGKLAVAPAMPFDLALQAVTFTGLAAEAQNRHFWQGRSGHWRELLPADVAAQIANPYLELMRRFGYAVDADPALTAATAHARWLERTAARAPQS